MTANQPNSEDESLTECINHSAVHVIAKPGIRCYCLSSEGDLKIILRDLIETILKRYKTKRE